MILQRWIRILIVVCTTFSQKVPNLGITKHGETKQKKHNIFPFQAKNFEHRLQEVNIQIGGSSDSIHNKAFIMN